VIDEALTNYSIREGLEYLLIESDRK
jgi:hypothetical protein